MLQVGVKAPGTAKSTTLRPANTVSVENFCVPSAVTVRNSALGSRSPILIIAAYSLGFARFELADGYVLFKTNVTCHHGQRQRPLFEIFFRLFQAIDLEPAHIGMLPKRGARK